MSFVSYAQNFEDVMLWRALKHVRNGFYIDVGANDPTIDSVTKSFYDQGWSGINIEPLISHHAALQQERPRDINLQCAAGEICGEIELWECDVRGWATADKSVIALHEANGHVGEFHKVPVLPLSEICNANVKGEIHFLKIDVEGFEKSVIEGMGFSHFRPWILVIEATRPNSTEEVYDKWESIVLSNNYLLAYTDGLNRFYVAKEHSELLPLLRYPPNVFDDFELNADHFLSRLAGGKATQLEAQLASQKIYSDTTERELVDTQALLSKTEDQTLWLQTELDKTHENVTTISQKNGQLEAQLASQKIHSDTIERELVDTQAQLSKTEDQTLWLQTELDKAHKNITTISQKNGQLEAQLANQQVHSDITERELVDTQAQLSKTEEQTQWLQAELDKTHEIVTTISQKNGQLEAQLANQQIHFNTTERELSDTQAQLRKTKPQSQSLQNELNAAKAKIDALHQSNHHWWCMTEQQSHELKSVYASKSWRITKPLRLMWQGISILINVLLYIPKALIKIIWRGFKWPFKYLLSVLMRFILKRPKLKAKAKEILINYPRLQARLRRFVSFRNITPNRVFVASENNKDHELEVTEDNKLNANNKNETSIIQKKVPNGINEDKKSPLEKIFY